MGIPKNKTDHKFTYKEYCSRPDDERWELIEGVAYDMCAAPFDVIFPVYPIKN